MGYKEVKLRHPVQVVRDVPLLPRKKRSAYNVHLQGTAAILAPWEDPSVVDISPSPTATSRNVKEQFMQEAKKARPKVVREVKWRSADGKMVVVAGPFPRGFFRTDTRTTVDKARRMSSGDMWSHEATQRDDTFAKCLAEDVVEILGGENEFGTVIP